MIPLNINFLKSQPTVRELRKVVMEAQSPINLPTKGDKFVARKGNVPECSDTVYLSESNTSLKPRTSDLLSKVANKINNIKNTQTAKADVFRELGIEVL